MKIRVGISLRMVLLITITAFLLFYATVSIIGRAYTNVAYEEAEAGTVQKVEQISQVVQSELNSSFEKFELYSGLAIGSDYLSVEEREAVFDNLLEKIIISSDNFVSVWESRALNEIDPMYADSYGRISRAYVRKAYGIEFVVDSLNMDMPEFDSYYQGMIDNRREKISDPHWSITKRNGKLKTQEATISIPIVRENKLVGIVGADIELNSFHKLIDSLTNGEKVILLSDNGTIVYHYNRRYIGEVLRGVDTLLYTNFDLDSRINSLESSSFVIENINGEDSVACSVSAFPISKSNEVWTVVVKTPLKGLNSEIGVSISNAKDFGSLGILLLAIIVFTFSRTIVKPISKTSNLLEEMSLGKINDTDSLEVKSEDELGRMADSVNKLTSRLQEVTAFAEHIGTGKFDMEFSLAGENDVLGKSVVNMRNSLQKAREDEINRIEEKRQMTWAAEGVNMFNRILRVDNQDIEQISYDIIKNLTNYTGSLMGGIYLKSEKDDEVYNLVSHVGFTKEKSSQKQVAQNEGEVGRCIVERETIFMNDIPEEYHKVSSGIGKSAPVSLLVVPLIHNDEVVGVVELESFDNFAGYQISFIEKLGETIASTIASVRINVRTANLLNNSQKQAEELEQQEEEMRQNMEEMQATQEETQKQEDELSLLIDGFSQILMIAEYDTQRRLVSINENYDRLYNSQNNQMLGKLHNADKFMSDEDKSAHEAFWSNILAGEVQETINYVKSGKKDFWVLEKFIPVKNKEGAIEKILAVVFDVTEQKKIETQIKQVQDGNYIVEGTGDDNSKSAKVVDLNKKFEIIDLTYLKMVYKKDPQKIYNILKLYYDTLPSQVRELKDINEQRDYKKLKSKINSLKTKMSYLGLKRIYEGLRAIEQLLNDNKNLSQITDMLEGTFADWSSASKELASILGISNS